MNQLLFRAEVAIEGKKIRLYRRSKSEVGRVDMLFLCVEKRGDTGKLFHSINGVLSFFFYNLLCAFLRSNDVNTLKHSLSFSLLDSIIKKSLKYWWWQQEKMSGLVN